LIAVHGQNFFGSAVDHNEDLFDFYLIPQPVNNGTVNPVYYNILKARV
jgi:hypothetical protein